MFVSVDIGTRSRGVYNINCIVSNFLDFVSLDTRRLAYDTARHCLEDFAKRLKGLKERAGVLEIKLRMINMGTQSRNKNERLKEQKKRFKLNVSEQVELEEDDSTEKLENESERVTIKLKRYQSKVNSNGL